MYRLQLKAKHVYVTNTFDLKMWFEFDVPGVDWRKVGFQFPAQEVCV